MLPIARSLSVAVAEGVMAGKLGSIGPVWLRGLWR
jgi:hypothetical protein